MGDHFRSFGWDDVVDEENLNEDNDDTEVDTDSLEASKASNLSEREFYLEDRDELSSSDDDYVGCGMDPRVEDSVNGATLEQFGNHLTEEDMEEFNEQWLGNDDDLHSPQQSDEESLPRTLCYNEVTGELAIGMLFTGVTQFREAFRRWAIERRCSHSFTKNCKTIVAAQCKQKCGFKIRASKLRDRNTFQIKTFVPIHNCPISMVNPHVNYKYVSSKYIDDLRDNPEWEVQALQKKVKRELLAVVSTMKCYRAKTTALKILQGEVDAQYHRLWDYGATIMKTNPGSLVKLKTDLQLVHEGNAEDGAAPTVPREKLVFQYMYVRFAPQKMGYFAGLRPIVSLDGCHLKTNMGGHVLAAIGRDGNENFFPLVVACVDECKESWRWFLQVLFQDYGSPSETGWVFMSDQQKGFIEALKEIATDMEHRFCVKHMYENYRKLFKGQEYRIKLWAVAKSGTEKQFLAQMNLLREFDSKAYEWVMNHDPKTWARCYFSTRTKSGDVKNNIAESFNAYILKARDMPILSMFEWIRKRLMKRQYVKLVGMKKYRGPICPNYQTELEKIKIESRNCFCTPAEDNTYVWRIAA